MKEFTVTENTTLKNFTDNTYPQGSFYFSRLLKQKDIRVNGKKAERDQPVREGDKISYYLTAKQESRPCFIPVYEDENILLADKESGVNSEALYASLRERGEYYFIHRLDRNTTGLIVFAKNKGAEEELLSCFKDRRVEKKYRALCFGSPKKDHEVLTAYLRKDEKRAAVQISDRENFGEKIVTEYRVLSRGEISCLEITLHTGKTHQIRAHLAHIGCPIVGDEKYGDSEKNARYKKRRQCLHAYSLCLHAGGPLQEIGDTVFRSERKFDITD